MRIQQLCSDAGLSKSDLASLVGVTEQTVRYWFKYQGIPKAVEELLRLRSGHSHHWPHFKFKDGTAVLPDGNEITSGQIQNFFELRRMYYTEVKRAGSLDTKLQDYEAAFLQKHVEPLLYQFIELLVPHVPTFPSRVRQALENHPMVISDFQEEGRTEGDSKERLTDREEETPRLTRDGVALD